MLQLTSPWSPDARACHEAKINIQEKPYDTKPSGSKNLQKKHRANTGHVQRHLDL